MDNLLYHHLLVQRTFESRKFELYLIIRRYQLWDPENMKVFGQQGRGNPFDRLCEWKLWEKIENNYCTIVSGK